MASEAADPEGAGGAPAEWGAAAGGADPPPLMAGAQAGMLPAITATEGAMAGRQAMGALDLG